MQYKCYNNEESFFHVSFLLPHPTLPPSPLTSHHTRLVVLVLTYIMSVQTPYSSVLVQFSCLLKGLCTRLFYYYRHQGCATDSDSVTISYLNEHMYFVITDTKVLCLGLIQSLFEGSMYTFVLEWTPALTTPESIPTPQKTSGDELPADDDGDGHRGSIPHGIIFAGFMVSKLITCLLSCSF